MKPTMLRLFPLIYTLGLAHTVSAQSPPTQPTPASP